MSKNNLKQILKEYELKRARAIYSAEQKKEAFLASCPELKKIDDKIGKISIDMSKAILSSNLNKDFENFENEIKKLKQEKEKILKSNNILYKDLLPIFECNICKDTGFVIENGTSTMCNCLKQRLIDLAYLQSNISKSSTDTFDNFNFSCYSNIPNKQVYGVDISPQENMKFIKNLSLDFVKNFDDPKTKNLIFIGNTGLR